MRVPGHRAPGERRAGLASERPFCRVFLAVPQPSPSGWGSVAARVASGMRARGAGVGPRCRARPWRTDERTRTPDPSSLVVTAARPTSTLRAGRPGHRKSSRIARPLSVIQTCSASSSTSPWSATIASSSRTTSNSQNRDSRPRSPIRADRHERKPFGRVVGIPAFDRRPLAGQPPKAPRTREVAPCRQPPRALPLASRESRRDDARPDRRRGARHRHPDRSRVSRIA